MALFSRFATISALLAVAGTACAPDEKAPDRTPPQFAGLTGAVMTAPGTARLSWNAASDRSPPVTYRVWTATTSGGHAFDSPPIAETQDLSILVAGLPTGDVRSYFVVRARDAKGNEERNTAERAVLFAENRLELRGTYELPIASDIAVSASSNVIALGAFSVDPPDAQVRAYLFDVSDPTDPQLLLPIYGEGRSTDVEIRGNVLWVATEQDPDEHGAYSYDISDPTAPVELGFLDGPGLSECHTLWIDGNTLYCASSEDGKIHLVDVTDPAAPVPQGSVGLSGAWIHDMYVSGDLAVGCFLWGGFAFFDASNPMNPTLGTVVSYENAFTHNAWPSEDGNYLFTTDENGDGHLRIWDISNRGNVTPVGEYYADPGESPHAIVHNVQVHGDLAFVGWYEAGVQVLDVSDPAAPVLVGWYDTYPGPTEGTYAGAWSAAPKLPYVYVSDFTSGLFVLELVEPR